MMRPVWRLALVLAFTAATLWLAVEAGAAATLSRALHQLGFVEFAWLGMLFAALRVCQAHSLMAATRSQNVDLGFSSSLDLAGLKGLYNLGFSGAGLIAQAVHARSRQLFTVGQLAWATALQSLLLLVALGSTLTLMALVSSFESGSMQVALLLFGMGACGAAFVLVRLITGSMNFHPPGPEWLKSKLSYLGQSGHNPGLKRLAGILSLQFGIVILRLARVLTIAFFINNEARLLELTLVTSFADLVTTVPLTPGGIGIREFLIGAGAEFHGNVDLFLAAAIIDRGFTLAANLVHGGVVLTKELLTKPHN